MFAVLVLLMFTLFVCVCADVIGEPLSRCCFNVIATLVPLVFVFVVVLIDIVVFEKLLFKNHQAYETLSALNFHITLRGSRAPEGLSSLG